MEKYLNECFKYFEKVYRKNHKINTYSIYKNNMYCFKLDTHEESNDKYNCIDFYLDIAIKFYDYLKEYNLNFIRNDDLFNIKIDFNKVKEDNIKQIEIKRETLKNSEGNFIPDEYLDIYIKDEYKYFFEIFSGKNYFVECIDEDGFWDGKSGYYIIYFYLTMK